MIRRTADYSGAMPNLALAGMSENWLLKESGHQHWLALAELLGYQQPAFRSEAGHSVYAAFVSVAVRNARLHRVGENDAFYIETRLIPVGKSRYFSQHQVISGSERVCEIDMISTLVSRTQAGNNQSVVRAQAAASAIKSSRDGSQPSAQLNEILSLQDQSHQLFQSYRGFRSFEVTGPSGSSCSSSPNINTRNTNNHNPDTHNSGTLNPATAFDYLSTHNDAVLDPSSLDPSGLDPASNDAISWPSFSYSPCPHSDFNGADFLYFANFQQAVDRAEWQYLTSSRSMTGDQAPWLWQTQSRQLSYFGNINPGDHLRVVWLSSAQNDQRLTHWQRIYRASDGHRIADVITHKLALDGSGYRRAIPASAGALL